MKEMNSSEMIRFLAEQHAYDTILRLLDECETVEEAKEKVKALLTTNK